MSDSVTLWTKEAVTAMNAALQKQIDGLTARVAKLETGTSPPPVTETPNLTVVMAGSGKKILDHNQNTWEITPGAQVMINTTTDTTTANVALIAKVDPDVWQMNSSGGWWSKSQSSPATAAWVGQPAAPPGVVIPVPPPLPTPVGAMRYNPGAPMPIVGTTNGIQVILNSPTLGVLNKGIFGVATGSLAHSPPWNYRMLTDPVSQAAFRDLDLRFVRINGITTVLDVFGPSGTNPPNWAAIDALLQGLKTCFPNAEFCMSFMNHDMFNYADAGMRAILANDLAAIVRKIQSAGIFIRDIEVINEPDFGHTPDVVVAMEQAARTAIMAVDPKYRVGGPVTSWARSEFIGPSAKAGAPFLSWHAYAKGPGQVQTDQQIYNTAIAWGANAKSVQTWGKNARAADYFTYLDEFGIDSWNDPGQTPDARQQNFKGAVFAALTMIASAYNGLTASSIWRLENDDGSYGVFQTGTWTVNPTGALMRAGNKYLGGTITNMTIGSTGTKNLLALNAVTDTTFGMIIVNYDTVSDWTGPVALAGRTSTTANVTRFDINESVPLGIATTVTAGGLSTITVAKHGVTILAGMR